MFKEKLTNILITKTVQETAVASSATVINGLLGLVFYPLVARLTGVADFGTFSILVLAITLLSDIANLGTDTGLVRFVGKYFQHEPQKALRYMKFAFKLKVVVALVLLVFSMVVPSLRMAFIGAAVLLLYSFATTTFQAIQRFKTWSVFTISFNGLRLLCVLVLATIGTLYLESALWVYIVVPAIGLLVALFILPRFWQAKNENAIAKEFFHYNKWVALFLLIAAVASRLDSFLTAHYLSKEAVGIYAAAVSLASIGPQVVAAIATVVAPKMASFQTKKEFLVYFKKLQMFLCALAAGAFVVGSVVSLAVIPLLFGSEYQQSITPFIFLLLAQCIFLISIPVHSSLMYYFAKPQIFFLTSIIHLLVAFVAGSVLIQNYSYLGAAMTVVLTTVLNLIIPAAWVAYTISNDKR